MILVARLHGFQMVFLTMSWKLSQDEPVIRSNFDLMSAVSAVPGARPGARQAEYETKALDQLRQEFGPNLPSHVVAKVRANEGEPVATKDASVSELESIPVIAADDVGAFWGDETKPSL
jgi:hypothetical protein